MNTSLAVPVHVATPAEERQVIAAMVLAFSADPIVRWVYPDPGRYLQHFPDLVRMYAHVALEQGTAYYTEGYSGVALWLAPQVKADDDAIGLFFQNTVPEERQATMFFAFEQVERFLPAEPYWYLPLIGVEPAQQGKGVGSALLAHALNVCDREIQFAFLEASSPKNVPLYQRYGFEVVGTIQEGTMPPFFPMVRVPQSG